MPGPRAVRARFHSRDLVVRRRGRAASSDADAMAAGRRLRQLIFDPLLPAVEARTRLVVSPDAALFSVPLECLPTDDGGHLIERYCISYAPSTPSVMYMRSDVIHDRSTESAATCSAPLVVGAPDYVCGFDAARAVGAQAAAPGRLWLGCVRLSGSVGNDRDRQLGALSGSGPGWHGLTPAVLRARPRGARCGRPLTCA